MQTKLFQVLLPGLFCALAAPVFGQVPSTERQALIDFYHATGGDEWYANEGWLGATGTECDWFGVECGTTDEPISQVHSLSLPANGLTGSLPEALVGLTELGSLRLSGNAIEGSIPPAFGDFDRLGIIDLRGNQLSGPVPGELLNTPANRIWLAGNRLDGYTPAVGMPGGNAVFLSVDLSRNPITSLPPASWRSAGTINHLDLARTALAGELDFQNHPWPGLETLNLGDNAIASVSGIDSTTLTDLRRWHLDGNQLTEQWPVSGNTLPSLDILDLTGNQLRTAPPADLSEHPALRDLRLAYNVLAGETIAGLLLLPKLSILELQHNPLKTLPQGLQGVVGPQNRLDLSHAGLEGAPPPWFSDLSVSTLNLSGNRLGGSPVPWLAALRAGAGVRLDLSNNRFEGPLPAELAELNYVRDSLDLCWNDFDEPFGEQFDDLFESAHFGGHPADCNGRELADIDPTISGSWYVPERNGKGYAVMLLDSGQLLHYWFGYPSFGVGQKWTFQMTEPDGAVADLPRSLAPRGGRFDFGLGAGTVDDYEDRKLRMVRLADDRLSMVSRLRPGSPDVILDPPPPPIHGRFDHVRLTSLAGATCDSQSRFQDLSGLWFNPERSGEGFVLEVLPDGRAVVYWFTYRPDATGRQVWMIGEGQMESSNIGTPPPDAAAYWVAFDAMIQPGGTVSGPGFDPSAIELVDWGKLHLDFFRQGTARASWESQLDGYGSGSYPLERLARPMLAECGEE
ncbi:MAG: hypothetical protein ACNA7J_04275 [Wenzhouxiangella sp.]